MKPPMSPSIMRRRQVILMLAGAAAGYPFVVRAQQSQQMRRIGVVLLYPENDPQGQLRATAFQRQLEKAGWTIGGNLQVNFEWGTGDADWVRSATERALRQAPDVLLANGDPAALAAYHSTKTVPTIFIGSGDPVGDGLVQSLARPGGNVTGFAVMEPSLGAKLLIDRHTLPHVWVKAAPFDPVLPIRGRYVRLALQAKAHGVTRTGGPVALMVEDGELIAVSSAGETGVRVRPNSGGDAVTVILADAVAFFIPEHVPDPSRLPAGEELWVEVTVPRKGMPRPVRLGAKRAGVLTPFALD